MKPLKEIDKHLYYWLKSQSFAPDDDLLKEGFEVVYSAKVEERIVELADRIARYEFALEVISGKQSRLGSFTKDSDVALHALSR